MHDSDSLNNVSERFYREARKLEVRLDDYLKDEEIFVKSLRNCIEQFESLHASIERLGLNLDPSKLNQILQLKKESEENFSEAIINEGKAQHERSHLLESYGALILALQTLEDTLKTDRMHTKTSVARA
jgi:hypothetical protein